MLSEEAKELVRAVISSSDPIECDGYEEKLYKFLGIDGSPLVEIALDSRFLANIRAVAVRLFFAKKYFYESDNVDRLLNLFIKQASTMVRLGVVLGLEDSEEYGLIREYFLYDMSNEIREEVKEILEDPGGVAD